MARLFTGDFETGNTSQFTSASGTTQGSVVLHGVYSGKNTDNTNFLKTLGSASPTMYMHGWYRWDVNVGTASNWFVLLADGETTTQEIVRVTNGTLQVENQANGSTYYGHNVLQQDTWYGIGLAYHCDGSAGWFDLQLNGITEVSKYNIDTKASTDTGIQTVKWQGINASGNCYIDTCTLDDSQWNMQKMTMRVSLPSYNALTDGTVDHYALFADTDNILIKEKTRGTINIGGYASGTITHGLGYIPYSIIFAKSGSNFYNIAGAELGSGFQAYYTTGTSNIIITHDDSGTITFYYYIFYDDVKTT